MTKISKGIFIFIFYLFLAIIFTFPLITKLGSFLPGQPNDAYVYLWNISNFWHQVFSGENIFTSMNIMYPLGTNLFFHTYSPLISFLGLPFLNNLSYYMGLMIIVAITLSSFTTFLLIQKITSSSHAAFWGGVIYGLSPILNSFIESQHFYFLFASSLYPLGILFLINFLESQKKKYLYFLFFVFWVVLFIDYYSAVLYVLLTASFFILEIIKSKSNLEKYFSKISLLKYFNVFLLIIVLPFLVIYVSQLNFREFIKFKQSFNSSSSCNSNLLGFFTPNDTNPFLKEATNTIRTKLSFPVNLDTPSYFLGWGLLILFFVSIIRFKKEKYLKSLVLISFLFLLLSLGTTIKFGEITLLEKNLTPYFYFLKLPLLKGVDCPIRFPVIIELCLAVVLGIFISKQNKIKMAIIFTALILVEYGVTNTNFSSVKVPAVYMLLSQEPGNSTLLEIPSGIAESKGAFGYDWSIQALHSQQMYWQTVHKKPRVGAYVSRIAPATYEYFKSEPVISEIFTMSGLGGEEPIIVYSDEEIYKFIKDFNLGFIILSPNPRQEMFMNYIENTFEKHIVKKKNIEGFIYYKLSLSQP